MKNEIRKIRIVQAPAGEAPLWVREAWVGIDLPLVRGNRSRKYRAFGALSGPKTFWRQIWGLVRGRTFPIQGYVVRADLAIELLSTSAPVAAEWWRENTPDLLRGILIFEEEVCRLLGTASVASHEI